MQISDGQAGSRPGEAQYFTGEVWMDQLAAPGEQIRLSMLRVHFSPSARTNWHQHPRGQILHVVDGVGRIQVRGEEVQTLRAGDTAVCPADEWHWHGAASDVMMTMISVQGADNDGAVVHWGEPAAGLQPGRASRSATVCHLRTVRHRPPGLALRQQPVSAAGPQCRR
jgi:quercetin dioxygenase-like cupin family protein